MKCIDEWWEDKQREGVGRDKLRRDMWRSLDRLHEVAQGLKPGEAAVTPDGIALKAAQHPAGPPAPTDYEPSPDALETVEIDYEEQQ